MEGHVLGGNMRMEIMPPKKKLVVTLSDVELWQLVSILWNKRENSFE